MYLRYLASPSRHKVDLADKSVYFVEMEQIAADALNFYNVCAVSILQYKNWS